MPMPSPLPTPHCLLVTTSFACREVFYKVSFGQSSQCQLMVGLCLV